MLDDVELFLRLNEEYASKPLVPSPPKYDPVSLANTGRHRATELDQRNQLRGKRVLEFGCGLGETAIALASEFDCRVVAVDINPGLRPRWAEHSSSGVDFRIFDISQEDTAALGKFDFIYSNGALEHVVHPFAMVSALTRLIAEGGRMHLNMGLHRGAIGSHLYREVYFPWPHLVFTDSAFEQFYQRIGKPPRRPVWINHLTSSRYLEMFDALGLHVTWLRYHERPLDEAFYLRFEDILNRYPRTDLRRDMMYVDLLKPRDADLLNLTDVTRTGDKPLVQRRIEALQQEVARCERLASAQRQQNTAQVPAPAPLVSNARNLEEIRSVAANLQQKVDRLELIEERFNKDLRGVRRLGRAVSWTGSVLRALVEPPVTALRSARRADAKAPEKAGQA